MHRGTLVLKEQAERQTATNLCTGLLKIQPQDGPAHSALLAGWLKQVACNCDAIWFIHHHERGRGLDLKADHWSLWEELSTALEVATALMSREKCTSLSTCEGVCQVLTDYSFESTYVQASQVSVTEYVNSSGRRTLLSWIEPFSALEPRLRRPNIWTLLHMQTQALEVKMEVD